MTASRLNFRFWDSDNMDFFTGMAGEGLLITPTSSVRDLYDVIHRCASSAQLLSLYLIL